MVDHRLVAASERGRRLSVPRLLYAVLGPPVIWGLHLAVCYFLVTLDCITAWDGGGWSVGLATALAAAGAAGAGWVAWRTWRGLGGGPLGPDEREWSRFLMVLGMAASVLFTLVILATGVAPLFVDLCAGP